jgi:hypothetical protein
MVNINAPTHTTHGELTWGRNMLVQYSPGAATEAISRHDQASVTI